MWPAIAEANEFLSTSKLEPNFIIKLLSSVQQLSVKRLSAFVSLAQNSRVSDIVQCRERDQVSPNVGGQCRDFRVTKYRV